MLLCTNENISLIDSSISEKLSPLLLLTVILCLLRLNVSAGHRLLLAIKFLLLVEENSKTYKLLTKSLSINMEKSICTIMKDVDDRYCRTHQVF